MTRADVTQVLGGTLVSLSAFFWRPVVGGVVAGLLLIVFGVALERGD